MKKIIITLILALTFTASKATEKSIIAEVIFENVTNKKFKLGEFIIVDLNKKTKITKAENFKITLPKKGKYKFSFVSEDFAVRVLYPTKINKREHTIIIRLMEKIEFKIGEINTLLINLEPNLTDKQIENQIANKTLNFVMNGIDNSIPKEYVLFKEKYGIGLVKENCVIDPVSLKKTRKHNKMIFDYLNKKYGTEWQTELKNRPFGIK